MFTRKAHQKFDALTNAINTVLAYAIVFAVLGLILLGIVLFLAIYSGILTTDRVYFVTGDTWQVFRMFGNEIASIQLTGNWIEQALQLGSAFVQSVLALFS